CLNRICNPPLRVRCTRVIGTRWRFFAHHSLDSGCLRSKSNTSKPDLAPVGMPISGPGGWRHNSSAIAGSVVAALKPAGHAGTLVSAQGNTGRPFVESATARSIAMLVKPTVDLYADRAATVDFIAADLTSREGASSVSSMTVLLSRETRGRKSSGG